jgi:hypothetical protein
MVSSAMHDLHGLWLMPLQIQVECAKSLNFSGKVSVRVTKALNFSFLYPS